MLQFVLGVSLTVNFFLIAIILVYLDHQKKQIKKEIEVYRSNDDFASFWK